MYLSDYHVHSTCSPDGHLTVSEIAKMSIDRGLNEICITDHLDTVYWHPRAPRWDFDWPELQQQIRQAQALYGDQIAIKIGAELGEAALSFERAEHLLQHAPALDFVIGSVHMAGAAFDHFDLYFMPEGDESYYHRVIDSYLEDVTAVSRWGKFNVLGHLTLPLRYIEDNYHLGMTFDAHMDQVAEIFSIIIPKGIGIECNTNRGNTPLPDAKILKLYRQMGGEVITLGSDAHTAQHIGCCVDRCQQLLKACGFDYYTTFTRGEPIFHAL